MDTSGYIMLSRQMALFRQMDVIANNVANANSTGYKAESVLFQEYLSHTGAGRPVSFSNDVATLRDLKQGELRHTGRPLDAAIEGEGYYVVDTPLGPRYTRAGSFRIDTAGNLVTAQGYAVQGVGGAITLGENDIEITIRENGGITAKTGAGTEEDRGQLRVVTFDNPRMLKKVSESMYSAENIAATDAEPVVDYRISQGAVENSNVNSVQQMTKMIKVSRSVGTTSKHMNDLHDLQRRAVNVISKQAQ